MNFIANCFLYSVSISRLQKINSWITLRAPDKSKRHAKDRYKNHYIEKNNFNKIVLLTTTLETIIPSRMMPKHTDTPNTFFQCRQARFFWLLPNSSPASFSQKATFCCDTHGLLTFFNKYYIVQNCTV